MKIKSLQISNILSFQHYVDVANAPKITFDDGLNIIIGENGAGKSTALEVINFLFKRMLYKQYNLNQELYSRRQTSSAAEQKHILRSANNDSSNGFRLEPNWHTVDMPQAIRIELSLDPIDLDNINVLRTNLPDLNDLIDRYANRPTIAATTSQTTYILDVALNKNDRSFTTTFHQGAGDFGFEYLSDYNFFKESIALYNLEHPDSPIASLHESFTLISSYRNYHAFERSISLKDHLPSQQIQQLTNLDFAKSLNAADGSEPTIFGLVRLRVAEKHFKLIPQKLTQAECEAQANNLPFIVAINNRLRVVSLECKIKLIDLRTWQYSFEFFDTRRGVSITDINSLSSGQKAIVHLVFEAYGRGDLKGGLVIIDEPEIHLHYQFQNEYLQVVRELNQEQSCQYILVTHSEALINSSTINYVKRFSLNADGHTEIKAPILTTDQRMLIKILDNMRSTYAFFAKKVILVEGDTDRYFFKSIIQHAYPRLDQEIAVLYIDGKGAFNHWRVLFDSFGLIVYRIADLDFAFNAFYPGETMTALKTTAQVTAFKISHPDSDLRIEAEYANRLYILKQGDLEHYQGSPKGLPATIEFCNNRLAAFLADDANPDSEEIRDICRRITQ